MNAIWYERTGAAPEVLEFGELPTPVAGPGEVRIRLEAKTNVEITPAGGLAGDAHDFAVLGAGRNFEIDDLVADAEPDRSTLHRGLERHGDVDRRRCLRLSAPVFGM